MDEVLVYGSIYDFTAKEFVESFAQVIGDTLTCRINTDGGGVEAGWSMVAKFNEFEGAKKVKIDGKAYSMGFTFALYADDVECLDVSQFMFHRASYGFYYEQNYITSSQIKHTENINKALRAAFEAKIDVEAFENLKSVKDAEITLDRLFSMDEYCEVFLTAQEAKKIGLVDRIVKITPQRATAINRSVAKLAASTAINDLFVEVPEAVQNKEEQTKHTKMNKTELQAKHPELFAEVVGEGIAQERDRVGAWAVYGDVDPEAVKKGIAGGEKLSQTAMADFARKAAEKKDEKTDTVVPEPTAENKKQIEAITEESDKTKGGAEASAEVPEAEKQPTEKETFGASLRAKMGINAKK